MTSVFLYCISTYLFYSFFSVFKFSFLFIHSIISDFFEIKTMGFKLSFNGYRRIFFIGFIDEFRTEVNSFA